MVNYVNGIITMNRGDDFELPLVITYGPSFDRKHYSITDKDTVYFALEEYNQPFEFALVRKVFTIDDAVDGNVIIRLDSLDTEYLLPGEYYYEIKIKHHYVEDNGQEKDFIDTIVPRRKFIILE